MHFWQSYLPAIHPYFTFRAITRVTLNGFSPNLRYALILWRSALGLLLGKFRQFLTELSAHDTIMPGYHRFMIYLCYCLGRNSAKIKWPPKRGLHYAIKSCCCFFCCIFCCSCFFFFFFVFFVCFFFGVVVVVVVVVFCFFFSYRTS